MVCFCVANCAGEYRHRGHDDLVYTVDAQERGGVCIIEHWFHDAAQPERSRH
jgi:hypothetical protein